MSNQRVLGLETEYPPPRVDLTQVASYAQIKSVDDNKLSMTGGSLSGNLDMSGKKIINLETGYRPANLNQTQAVSYLQLKYVDNNKLDKTGGTVTGNINMSGKKIIGLETFYPPADLTQAVGYAQLKSVENSKLDTTGDTMTDNLSMSNSKVTGLPITSPPASDLDAISYAQLKEEFAPYLRRSGGAMSGNINMRDKKIITTYAPVNPNDLTNETYVHSLSIGIKRTKNNVGYIPTLYKESDNRVGFEVSASSYYPENYPRYAFSDRHEWTTNGDVENFSIKIKCPLQLLFGNFICAVD